MHDTLAIFWSGLAIGALGVTALGVGRTGLDRSARLATVLACLCAAAWVSTESEPVWEAFGRPYILRLLAFPAAGAFWAFVACVFDDRPFDGLVALPMALLAAAGLAIPFAPPEMIPQLWAGFNAVAALLGLHAVYLIVRNWRDDLVDARRRSRALVLGLMALFAAAQGIAGAAGLLGEHGAWAALAVRQNLGAAAVAALGLALGGVLLQARASLFAQRARPRGAEDPRIALAERALLNRLDKFMETGGWRRERLSIGELAAELGAPEHRLRRLINVRLGRRNFADFVNGYRIRAAQARLSDPTEADITVAAIAFDLGFGSLSPFNRAFRAVTGSTPTAWRRQALGPQIPADPD
ncbi:MAG: helix-turn-helix domain-containing protein [Phenylobacterium sp.]|nr:helix-turn-helix domain-containing protein [Phenylobacterium sp.]